jgi:protein dpy-30
MSQPGRDDDQTGKQQTQTNEEELKEHLGDTFVPLLEYALDELEKLRPPDPVLFLAHFFDFVSLTLTRRI